MNPSKGQARGERVSVRGWIGLGLIGVCWPLNWGLPGVRTAYLFFPLWLGYILSMDALVQRRTGSSLWSRSRMEFFLLFAASAPVWWIFEAFNIRTDNWRYVGAQSFGAAGYFLLCTVSFSTVMPAVFETAEWIRSWQWIERFRDRACLPATRPVHLGLLLSGVGMLALVLAWPHFCYPFVWTALVLILEPLNRRLGRRTLLESVHLGDWRPVVALGLGALVCGFFWEMWNFYSCPKWVYSTPGAQFCHLFEMPLPGYGGYVPFALELFALRSLLLPRAGALRL